MTTLKTPGVYVKEISVFPPSVAQVETAVPAFIGYTQQAMERSPSDLDLKPKKIESMVEYELYFGGAPPLNIKSVELAADSSITKTKIDPAYYLFHSLQLFFSNGGGKCYIVSVGTYGSAITVTRLKKGLAEVEKEDEPTMLVVPDSVLLPATHMYTLQEKMLKQCGDLGDRVAIFDLWEYDAAANKFDWEAGVDAFRDNIGTSNLKYGAAYTPHLRTNLPKVVTYRDFRNTPTILTRFMQSGSATTPSGLQGGTETKVASLIEQLEEAAKDLDLIENEYSGRETNLLIANASPENTLLELAAGPKYGMTVDADDTLADIVSFLHMEVSLDPATATKFKDYVDFLYEIVIFADGWLFDTTSTHTMSLKYRSVASAAAFKDAVTALVAFDKGAEIEFAAAVPGGAPGMMNRFALAGSRPDVPGRIAGTAEYPPIDFAAADVSLTGPAANTTPFSTGTTLEEKRRDSLVELGRISEQLLGAVRSLTETAQARYANLEQTLVEQLPAYKNLLEQLKVELSTLPPSGAIAGIYARVDRTRGVWKTPANESLLSVTDFTVQFTEFDTDGLNINDFGKSINALKFFIGLGHLVWGGRTLAGNDNEWRYISVRRFFNMVEESVKKSTMWAVFEPNDAGTWLKVRGMIVNFLTLQWRAGALQGGKPDDAFFVKIGLGETMTPIDILEGRMIVEIGMAVVRPAEFIILKFMHKMVQSG